MDNLAETAVSESPPSATPWHAGRDVAWRRLPPAPHGALGERQRL